MESKLLKYSLFTFFLFVIIQNFPNVPISREDNLFFCLIVLIILVSLDNIESTEAFTISDSKDHFKKAFDMFKKIQKNGNVEINKSENGLSEDKYHILKEASKLFTKEDDIKNYYYMKNNSISTNIENVTSKYANVITTTDSSNVVVNTNEPKTTSIVLPDISTSNVTVSSNTNVVTDSTTSKEYITKQDAEDIIKKLVYKKTYLEDKDYAEKDPEYYTNKGDLIDRSWENQFVILDTKHWKPYIPPPPPCLGKDDTCVPCPTTMHTPYLELKQFDKSRKILSA